MQLSAFRIRNFRSIVDTEWCFFSRDRVTVLVGQNESGKTSVLEALHCMLGAGTVTADDRRAAAPSPEFQLRVAVTAEDFADGMQKWCSEQCAVLFNYLSRNNGTVELTLAWEPEAKPSQDYSWTRTLADESLGVALDDAWKHAEAMSATHDDSDQTSVAVADQAQVSTTRLTADDLSEYIGERLPESTLFNATRGLLPNQIDIDAKFRPSGADAIAATNFLLVAGLDLQQLISADRREREFMLKRANDAISADFNQFWTQTIGQKNRLSIRCELENYGVEAAEKAGKPHLVFWIGDGRTQLYPRQRSEGVRWFVSFYLQLRASELRKVQRMFLMDEPGANLHPRAQEDVLRLINTLSTDLQIVYSTHSSSLLEYTKLYRVHAVQRQNDFDDSPTVVIDAHRLGAASTDTLSPLLIAMGMDLSHQEVVKKRHNVILEEVSGFYYFQAFWLLSGSKQEAHFIAASGANNIPTLANMFRGWGLSFVAVMDDDTRGRGVYKDLKRDLFGDDDVLSGQSLLKIRGCSGIEDIFSPLDFKRHILREDVELKGKNTEHLRNTKRSKPVMAYQLLDDLIQKKITRADFEAATLAKVEEVVAELAARLAYQNAA